MTGSRSLAQFGQLAPPQPGLDVRLDEQPHHLVPDDVVKGLELLGGDDAAGLAGDRGSTYAAAGMDRHDLVGEGRGEHGVEDDLDVADSGGSCAVDRGEPGDPFANRGRVDVAHPQVAQFGQDVSVDQVPVVLAGRRLDDVMRQPLGLDVLPQRLPGPSGSAARPAAASASAIVAIFSAWPSVANVPAERARPDRSRYMPVYRCVPSLRERAIT